MRANGQKDEATPGTEPMDPDIQLKETRKSVLISCNLMPESLQDNDPTSNRTSDDDTEATSTEICKRETIKGNTSSVAAGTKKDTASKSAVKDIKTLEGTATILGVAGEKDAKEPSESLRVGVAVPVIEDATVQPHLSRQPQVGCSSLSVPGAFPCAGISANPSDVDIETSSHGDDDIEALSPRSFEEARQQSCNLTVASKVTEDVEWPQAQQVDAEEAELRRRVSIKMREESRHSYLKAAAACFFALMALIVVVAIVLVTVRGSNDGDSNNDRLEQPQVQQTPPPTLIPEDHLLSLLPDSTLKEILDPDNDSPQKQAYEWMIEDPNLAQHSDSRLLQRFALAAFYYSTTSMGEWFHNDHWLSYDVHECSWYHYQTHGFYEFPETEEVLLYNVTNATAPCNEEDVYEHLWFVHNGLEGTLPEELYFLSSLKSISLDRNKLQGPLSTQIGKLTDLEALALYTNEMTGQLPSELSLLTNVEYLWIMKNIWTGTIPSQLGLLSDALVYLLLDNNQLTGSFPSELGQLSNLLWFWLYSNQLTGTLPTEMGLMETVESVAIDFNPFEGPIPTEVGTMTNMGTFHIDTSFMTGTIPTEFGLCTNMYSLVFPNTLITGSIPSELGLTNVERRLWGYNTALTGTLPTELGMLTRLATLALQSTQLTGPLPSELGNMAMVWQIHLSESSFTGRLPTEIGQLQNLWTLWLQDNKLTGPIPSQLGAVDDTVDFWDEASNSTVEYWNITELQLDNNQFSGQLPSSLASLTDLATFSIHNNSDLTGVVPTSFCAKEEGLVVSVDCMLVDCNCSVCSCM